MSKSIKLKNNTYIDSSGISHNKQNLKTKLDHSGSFARLGLTNGNWKPPGINSSYRVIFDKFDTTNNEVFSYNPYTGGITILSDKVKCVNVEVHLRISQANGAMYAYINSSDYGTVLGDTGHHPTAVVINRNFSCAIPVHQGSEIYILVYSTGSDCAVIGADYAWAGATFIAY